MSIMEGNERTITTLGELIDAYRQHLALGSRHSLRAFDPLSRALDPLRGQEVGAWHAAQWRQWFEEHCQTSSAKPLGPATRNLRYRHLRAMYSYPEKWMGQRDIPNPFGNSGWRKVAPSPQQRMIPVLSNAQIEEIEKAPRTHRNRLLIRLLAERGRRIGETLAIRAGDFRDLEAGTDDKRVLNFPHTKSGREQWTVLPEALAKDLKIYIRKRGLQPEERVFPVSHQAARAMVHRAAKTIGLNLSPHDLRRGLCGRLEREGVPMSVIKALVGHTSTRVTERYYVAERTAAELAAV